MSLLPFQRSARANLLNRAMLCQSRRGLGLSDACCIGDWMYMLDFYEFLMDELGSVTEEFETDSECAHEICTLLSVDGNNIPETFFRLYTANLSINQLTMLNAVSYFCGMGLMSVDCDCESHNKSICEINIIEDSPFYEKGEQDKFDNSSTWIQVNNSINSLREDIFA